MDMNRKKELIEQWKNRRPDMGVISIKCRATGESFLGASKDVQADFNSARAKLSMGWHPNKKLMKLWAEYGAEGFDDEVIKVLKYEDPAADYTAKLEAMRDECLAADPLAQKIWK